MKNMSPDVDSAASGGTLNIRNAFWNSLRMESDQSLDLNGSHGSLGSSGSSGQSPNPAKEVATDARQNANAVVGRKTGSGSILKTESNGKSTIGRTAADGAPAPAPGQRLLEQKSSSDRRQQRSVAFAPRVRVKLTTSLMEYTDDELDEVWTTDDDRRRNQADIIETVQWMRENVAKVNLADTESFCTRGLEHMRTPESYEQKKMNRERVMSAVFDEQEKQWLEEFHNSRDIADASGNHSEVAKQTAMLHAITDEQYVAARRRSSHLRMLQNAEKGMRGVGSLESLHGAGRRRRSSRVSFEKHGDHVLDEIIAFAEKCENEDPVGRRRSVESEKGEKENDADDDDSSVPVISRIDNGIIRTEVEAGRMVQIDLDDDEEEGSQPFNLEQFETSGGSMCFNDSKPSIGEGDGNNNNDPPTPGRRRRASFSFFNKSKHLASSMNSTGTGASIGGGAMETILDNYSSDGSACGSVDDDARSMDGDAPLVQALQSGGSSSGSPKQQLTAEGSTGVLGVAMDGKESFMSAFRKAKRHGRRGS